MPWLNVFKKKPKEEWRIVKECTPISISFGNQLTPHTKQDGEIYIYLYESNLGNRTLQARSTISEATQEQIDRCVKASEVYMRRIYRWLMGRADPEIMRFDEVEQEETVHYLQGTISEKLVPFTEEDK